MKRILKSVAQTLGSLVPLSFIERYLVIRFGYSLLYFSLNGEDILLQQLLKKEGGFYVDVGAHHPTHFSNTYLLYRKGWHGINIDATPGKITAFKSARPRDINLECAISSSEASIEFFLFDKSPLNTGSHSVATAQQEAGHKLVDKTTVHSHTLSSVLEKHALNKKIDFLNIDVEGFDLAVLESNDWDRYTPIVIAIEDLSFDAVHPEQSDIADFLFDHGYNLVAFLGTTLIFKHHE